VTARRRTLVILAAALGTILAAEGMARLADPWLPEGCAPQSATGYGLAPNARYTTTGENGPVAVKIDSRGLRGPEITLPKPDDAFRILAIGDEALLAGDTPLADTFGQLLAGGLTEDVKPARVELAVAAAPGWGPRHYAAYLAGPARELAPDFLMIVLATGTDLEPPSDPGRVGVGPRRGFDAALARVSALWRRVVPPPALPEGGLDDAWLRSGVAAPLTEAEPWLARLDEFCRAARLPWLLVVLPAPVQLDASLLAERRRDAGLPSDVAADAVNHRLSDFCRERRLACADLYSDLAADADRFPLYRKGGWTLAPAGHQAAANALIGYFRRFRILEQALVFRTEQGETR